MAMGQDNEVGALEPVLEAFRMLGIAGPEWVDQHAVAGDVQMKRRMTEPGQLHGRIPPAACPLPPQRLSQRVATPDLAGVATDCQTMLLGDGTRILIPKGSFEVRLDFGPNFAARSFPRHEQAAA